MFPFRTSSIFRSRWMALLWAGGIIFSALQFAGTDDSDSDEAPSKSRQAASVRPTDNSDIQHLEKLVDELHERH